MRRERGSPARRLWRLVEPYHALTYFAPEARDAFEAAGLRGFWRGYFAGRAAPLGEVGPGVVTACFYGFHPDFVGRALPSIWTMADPPTALDARLAGVDAALRRVLGESVGDEGLAEAAAIVRGAVESCPAAGRPVFAANAELEWPEEPHLALWHAATLLREHRGDGHVVGLVGAGLDPCEAHVSKAVSDGIPYEALRPYRGWSEEDWVAAADRLRTRGWLEGDGRSRTTPTAWLRRPSSTWRMPTSLGSSGSSSRWLASSSRPTRSPTRTPSACRRRNWPADRSGEQGFGRRGGGRCRFRGRPRSGTVG